jgi:hypothetical protein
VNEQYWHFLGLKPGASAAEISAARNRLAKLYHPDRGGTAEDMARLNEAFEIASGKRQAPSSGMFGSSSSSGSLADLVRIMHLEATIRGLQDQLERARKAHDDTNKMWRDMAREEYAKVKKFEHLARSLALTMLNAAWVNSKSLRDEIAGKIAKPDPDTNFAWDAPTDEVIEIGRRLIDELKVAIAKANEAEQQPANLIKCAAPGCANTFHPRRRNHKTCSDRCRQALSRAQAARDAVTECHTETRTADCARACSASLQNVTNKLAPRPDAHSPAAPASKARTFGDFSRAYRANNGAQDLEEGHGK